MPIYTYQVIRSDGSEGEMFDVAHGMNEPPLTQHPETGEPVRRIYRPVHIAGPMNERYSRSRLSDKNLERHGFTKYQKTGKGQYERTAGTGGPERFSAG